MLFTEGVVYRDVNNSVDFLVVRETVDVNKNTACIRLLNIHNWILLERLDGRIQPSGAVSCQLDREFSEVAPSLRAYYKLGK